jgi:hypothetical protein
MKSKSDTCTCVLVKCHENNGKSDGVPETVNEIFRTFIFKSVTGTRHRYGEIEPEINTARAIEAMAKYKDIRMCVPRQCETMLMTVNRIKALAFDPKKQEFRSAKDIQQSYLIFCLLIIIASTAVSCIAFLDNYPKIIKRRLNAADRKKIAMRSFKNVFLATLKQKTTYGGSWASFGIYGAVMFLCHRYARLFNVCRSFNTQDPSRLNILFNDREDGSLYSNIKDLGNYAMMTMSLCRLKKKDLDHIKNAYIR